MQAEVLQHHKVQLDILRTKLELFENSDEDDSKTAVEALHRMAVSTRVARLRLQFDIEQHSDSGGPLPALMYLDSEISNPLQATALCIAKAQHALSKDYRPPVMEALCFGSSAHGIGGPGMLGSSVGPSSAANTDLDALVARSLAALEDCENKELNRDLVSSVTILAQRLAASEHELHLWREQQESVPQQQELLTPKLMQSVGVEGAEGEDAAMEQLTHANKAVVAASAWLNEMEVLHRWELGRSNQGINAIAAELSHKQAELSMAMERLEQLSNQQVNATSN